MERRVGFWNVPNTLTMGRLVLSAVVFVLIDAPAPEAGGLWVGRTFADAPDVDGVVYASGRDLEPGDLVGCEIVAAEGYDLVARAGALPPRKRRARPKGRKKPSGSSSSLTILN